MKFFSTISTDPDHTVAADAVSREITGQRPDLAIVFTSHHHGPKYTPLLEEIRERINPRNLIGCTGESIIGPNMEVEGAPAVALWTAWLPGVRVLPFVVDQDDISRFEDPNDWHERLGVHAEDKPSFIVLPEPFSIDADRCMSQLDRAFPSSTIVGGMASGGTRPDQNRLFINDQVLRYGLVGVTLNGPVRITTVVSQGCRPIGKPYVVTKSQENIIIELGGRPVMEVLQEVYQSVTPQEKELMQGGLHVGRVVDEHLHEFKPGDFLIRNLLGIVQNKAIAVNAMIRPGQTIQFHVRDSSTASEEMRGLLRNHISSLPHTPEGGLLFSCNGRGTRMFGVPNHDVGLVNAAAKDCQVAGFFAAGEIGPVGNRTFIHGFTSSLILFSTPE